MRTPIAAVLAIVLTFGCTDTAVTSPDAAAEVASPSLTVIGGDNPEGAIVLNKGEASGDFTGFCTFGGQTTNDVTLVRRPNGGGLLSCHWDEFLPPGTVDQAVVNKGFGCFLNFGGFSLTTKSLFTLAPSGVANMHCTFNEVI